MPFMRSESCSFIWHPNVVTWKRFTALVRVSRGAKVQAGWQNRGMRELATPLSDLAARQHGVVSVQQLTELRLDKDAVRRRVRDGRLHLVHRGVYAVGHARLTREGRWLAAVLGSGP